MTVHAPETPVTARRPRYGGLDGLRAIAVAMVLIYHLFPGTLQGGYLGVDVFFVISGFLITSLLLNEHEAHGKIRLVDFWRRRARRLLPALGLVIAVSTSLAVMVGGDILVRIGSQIAGAAFFVNNWVLIAGGSDYFAHDTPELLRNTWSLSIEEQFYLVLPLILLAVIRPGLRGVRTVMFLALGAASAVWMVVLSLEDAAATRIYFGSDTHTFGLFWGVALACLVHREAAATTSAPSRRRERLTTATTILGLLTIAVLTVVLPEGSRASFEGGFQLATIAALAVVWAVTREGARVGRMLDVAPLRWVGERSYGIYLWHWPLHIITGEMFGPSVASGRSWAVGAVTLVLSLGLAALSFTYIEQPVRRLGLRRSLSLLFAHRRTTTQRVTARAVMLVLAVCIPATIAAVAVAPTTSTAEAAVARGEQYRDQHTDATAHELEAAEANSQLSKAEVTSVEAIQSPAEPLEGGPFFGGGAAGTTEDKGTVQTSASDEQGVANEQSAGTGSMAAPATGADISAVGDSVMLASLPELSASFPGIDIDADVSRGLGAGLDVLQHQADAGRLRSVLVVGLGTNGPVQAAELDSLRTVAGQRHIVLVNAHGDREWIPGVNKTLTDFAERHRGIVIADWDTEISPQPDSLAGDGIHPHESGGKVYAETVRGALNDLASPDEAVGYRAPRF